MSQEHDSTLTLPGGQGIDKAPEVSAEPIVLADPHHTRGDLKMIETAIRNGWAVPNDKRPKIVARMLEIVEKRKTQVMTREGPAEVDSTADVNSIAAAKVLVLMNAQDQDDDHEAEKYRRIDSGKATERTDTRAVVLHVKGVDGSDV